MIRWPAASSPAQSSYCTRTNTLAHALKVDCFDTFETFTIVAIPMHIGFHGELPGKRG